MKPASNTAFLALAAGLLVAGACANSEGIPGAGTAGTAGPGAAGTTGAAGTGAPGTAGTTATAGTTGAAGTSAIAGSNGNAGTTATAGTTGAAGTTATAGSSGAAGTTAAAGRGGTTGAAGRGGTTGGAGRGGTTGMAGTTGAAGTSPVPLDCGPMGYVVENHGPSANRVTYVILGDGYTTADLAAGGAFERHIAAAMLRRFSPNATPYDRYRNFVNICAIKIVSTGPICGSSALGCCGSDSTRLANCNTNSGSAIANAFNALPTSLNIDWKAVMLNGSSWWNSGGITMLWSGGHMDASGAALHEGGHGFHQLADEYGGTNSGCSTEYGEVNSTANMSTTAGKWDLWLGYNQAGATGMQIATNSGFSQGSRYCNTGQYRPSDNSMMNSLFCNNSNQATCRANTAFNSVSREQMVFSIWKFVHPIDSTEPPMGAVTNPGILKVNVIDPAVISVDWTVDGTTMTNAGTTFDTSTLGAGAHTISAKAYDNAGMDLVRYKTSTCASSITGNYCHRTAWKNSIQTVMWTFTK